MVTSLSAKPKYLKTSTFPVCTLSRVKIPSKSVCIPLIVPLITTLTPGKGLPDVLSFTTPLTVCCANMLNDDVKRIPINNNLNFSMYNLLNNNFKFDFFDYNKLTFHIVNI